ncbi:MAG: hypothetical protein JWL65_3229, partial [Gammaproteobacteria bacterium]|nr:hypothetical protein [Gammaproteobacteria bacterium]
IVLAPADAQLPDHDKYQTGRSYRHPDLRLSVSYENEDYNEWSDLNREIAKAVAGNPDVQAVLAGLPHLEHEEQRKHHFLCRLILQNRLAKSTGATLIGNAAFHRISALAAPTIVSVTGSEHKPAEAEPQNLGISERLLDVVGLNFSPDNLEVFAAIRESKDITTYATAFREALVSAAASPSELETKFLQLMRDAMESEDVARRVSGGLSTAGSVLEVAGLVPVIGTVAGALGIGTDAGKRVADKRAEGKSWYLLGTKMQEVGIRDRLKRLQPRT